MKRLFFSFSIVMLAITADAQTTPAKTKPATTTTKPVTTATKPTAEKDTLKPPAGEARPGDNYGVKVTIPKFIDEKVPDEINNIVKTLSKGKTFEPGKFYAKVKDVCYRDGCWVTLEIKDTLNVVVKMKENGFFLPLAAKGKKVLIDGEVHMKTIAVEDLKLFAAHLKKTKKEIDAIALPEKQVMVVAKGILVVE